MAGKYVDWMAPRRVIPVSDRKRVIELERENAVLKERLAGYERAQKKQPIRPEWIIP